jgi:flagellar hook-associated protein 1 FlgK
MAVNPDIVADPTKLAGAAVGQPAGDNSGFLALAGLADQPSGNGRTFIADGIRVLSNLGGETRRAAASRDLEVAGAEALAAARDSVSGVSTEEEMAKLSEFQRASQAATKFISTVDDMLRGLLEGL